MQTLKKFYFGKSNVESIPFVSTWKTDNLSSGSSAATQVKLPLIYTGTYNFVVDWGDNTTSTITTYNQATVTHTYSVAGTYQIKINGVCNGWRFNADGDRSKILSVQQWGTALKLGTYEGGYFYGCDNLNLSSVTDTPVLAGVLNMSNCFTYCSALTTINKIGEWACSNVTNMSYMFSNTANFNQDISSLDTSNVTNMLGMFSGAANFNQDISSLDTSKVTNMSYMFSDAANFNNGLASGVSGTMSLNTTNVTNMLVMFQSATNFNQNIGSWNVSNVINMSGMFYKATNFNQNIGSWNVSKVTNMSYMFSNTANFNQNIGSWNTSAVTNMNAMFQSASAFNQSIGSWNVSNVTNFVNFMSSKTTETFSTTNLDAIYNGWSSRPVKTPISISFGTAKYTAASSAGRAILTGAPNNWVITDGGI
jgi:surface protein